MGYDLARFTEDIDEDFKCSICTDVLEDPVQFSRCEHIFCRECITTWLNRQSSCPFGCYQNLSVHELVGPPRVFRNFIGRLNISCDFKEQGCSAVVKLEQLETHKTQCTFDPDRPAICEKGCGLQLMEGQASCGNCVQSLRKEVDALRETVEQLKKYVLEIKTNRESIATDSQTLRSNIDTLEQIGVLISNETQTTLVASMQAPNRQEMGGTSSQAQTVDERHLSPVERWCFSLSVVKVRMAVWLDLMGYVESDDEDLTVVRSCLQRSGCPSYVVRKLTDWQSYYSNILHADVEYFSQSAKVRRIPGCSAVVAMALENMSAEDMPKPGILFLFPNGAL